jgi:hypothetical protein
VLRRRENKQTLNVFLAVCTKRKEKDMKKFLSCLAMSLLVGVLAVSASFADGKNESSRFTLSEDIMVGGTLLEKGTYRFKFYGDTNTLKISEADGDVVKTMKVNVVHETEESKYDALTTRNTAHGKVLLSVKFDGDHRTIIVADSNIASESELEEGF